MFGHPCSSELHHLDATIGGHHQSPPQLLPSVYQAALTHAGPYGHGRALSHTPWEAVTFVAVSAVNMKLFLYIFLYIWAVQLVLFNLSCPTLIREKYKSIKSILILLAFKSVNTIFHLKKTCTGTLAHMKTHLSRITYLVGSSVGRKKNTQLYVDLHLVLVPGVRKKERNFFYPLFSSLSQLPSLFSSALSRRKNTII